MIGKIRYTIVISPNWFLARIARKEQSEQDLERGAFKLVSIAAPWA